MTISSGSPRSALPLSRLVPTRAAGASFVDAVYGPELLSNGGFETVTAPGPPANFGTWTETAGDGNIEVEITLVHSGTNACKLTCGTSGNTQISYPYGLPTVIPGLTYSASFWACGDSVNAGLWGVADSGTGIYMVPISSTGVIGTTYQNITAIFTVPAGCTGLYLVFICPQINGGIAYFDDVSVRQIL